MASSTLRFRKGSATLKKDAASNVNRRDIEPMNARRELQTIYRTKTQDIIGSLIENNNLLETCHQAETFVKPRWKKLRRKSIPLNPSPKPKVAESQADPTKERAASIKAILGTFKPEEQDAVFNLLAEEGF